jgi:hypothetical protein
LELDALEAGLAFFAGDAEVALAPDRVGMLDSGWEGIEG